MRTARWLVAAVVAIAAPVAAPGVAAPAPAAQSPPPVVVSTAAQRTSLRLTVYSNGLALVQERRRVDLPAGDVTLRYEGIPAAIEPASVRLVFPSTAGAVRVTERSFHPATLSPRSLLRAYVGKQVQLAEHRYVNGKDRRIKVSATLISDSGGYVWRVHGHLQVLPGWDQVPSFAVPRLPASLYPQPTLVWRLHSPRAGPRAADVQYLVQDIYWRAEYSLTLAANGKTGDLSGVMMVVNNNDYVFPHAQLRLVAGQVPTATPPSPRPRPVRFAANLASAAPPAAAAAPPSIAAQPVFAYHLYSIPYLVSLAKPGNDAIPWLAATPISVRKTYIVHGSAVYMNPMQSAGQSAQEPVEVQLSFINRRADGLGRPLPAGTVRIYAPVAGASGGPVFLGAARMPDTPLGGTVRLQAGHAFDLQVRRVQTRFQTIKPQHYQASYQVTLRNSTPRAVQVRDDEQLRGAWTILHSSHPFTQPNASTARFIMTVPANGTQTITYTVQEAY